MFSLDGDAVGQKMQKQQEQQSQSWFHQRVANTTHRYTHTHRHTYRDRNVRRHARTGIDTHVRPVGVAPAGRGRGRGSCLRDFVDFPQCKPIFVSIKAKVLNWIHFAVPERGGEKEMKMKRETQRVFPFYCQGRPSRRAGAWQRTLIVRLQEALLKESESRRRSLHQSKPEECN